MRRAAGRKAACCWVGRLARRTEAGGGRDEDGSDPADDALSGASTVRRTWVIRASALGGGISLLRGLRREV